MKAKEAELADATEQLAQLRSGVLAEATQASMGRAHKYLVPSWSAVDKKDQDISLKLCALADKTSMT